MNMKDAISLHEKRKRRKRMFHKGLRKVAVVIIGYPFLFPYEKLKEKFTANRKEYWNKNLDKLREKSLSEIICYIEKDLAGESSYHVYNAPCHDAISYSNAFYLQHFVGYGGSRYRKKDNPFSKLYKELYSKKNKDTFNDSSFYEDLYQTLLKKIQSKYKDIHITEGTDRYYRKYRYFQLKIERQVQQ